MNYNFEDKIEEINQILAMKRGSWNLKSLKWLDYDDICQEIKCHILEKWEQWDQSLPLKPWVSKLISHQIINQKRDRYYRYARPCLRCNFNEGESFDPDPFTMENGTCGYTPSGRQCNECPIYAHWEEKKKSAFNIKVPVAIEKHENTQFINKKVHNDTEESVEKLKNELKRELDPRHYKVFVMRFIEGKSVADVAQELNFESNEKGREPGYKQIKNIENQIKALAKDLIRKRDIL